MSESIEFLQTPYLFLREVFGTISVTADEIPGLLLVWISFLGAYLVFRKDGHIAFDLLVKSLNKNSKKIFQLINKFLISAFLALLLWQSIRMILVSGATEIETAEIAQGWFMLILPITAILMLIALAFNKKNNTEKDLEDIE